MPERHNDYREPLKEGQRILVKHGENWVPATVNATTWRGKSSFTTATADDGYTCAVNLPVHWRPIR